jgi:hypothetical protein
MSTPETHDNSKPPLADAIGSARCIPPAMTIEELIAHKADIQRQARKFMESKGVFEGLPEEERWKHCVRIVADAWRMLGPQLDELPPNAAGEPQPRKPRT